MDENEVHVLISIPTREEIHAQTVGWLLNATKIAKDIGYKVTVQILQSPYPIEMQRNNQVKNFLDSEEYTHLFLLDSDCVPQQLTIEKLLDYDLDVVASVAGALINGVHCITAATRVAPEDVVDGKEYLFPYSEDKTKTDLEEVDAVGATGVLIKRHVIEALEPPYFEVIYNEDGTSVNLGEDYYFCQKIKEAGFKIFADFGLRQNHYKTVAI